MSLADLVDQISKKHLADKGGLPRLRALHNRQYRCLCIWREREETRRRFEYIGIKFKVDDTLAPGEFKLVP